MDITPVIKIDHATIGLSLSNSYESVKGPGFWKMNVSPLDDEKYLNELDNNFPKWKTTGINNLLNKRSVWDWLKYNIQNYAISYSSSAREVDNTFEI